RGVAPQELHRSRDGARASGGARHPEARPLAPRRGLVLIQALMGMAEAILIETSLSYLGFGVQEPQPSWGNMVALGKDYFFRGDLWISTAPAAAILITVVGFHLLGDAVLARLEETGG